MRGHEAAGRVPFGFSRHKLRCPRGGNGPPTTSVGGGNLTFSWEQGTYNLQSATVVDGPYINITNGIIGNFSINSTGDTNLTPITIYKQAGKQLVPVKTLIPAANLVGVMQQAIGDAVGRAVVRPQQLGKRSAVAQSGRPYHLALGGREQRSVHGHCPI